MFITLEVLLSVTKVSLGMCSYLEQVLVSKMYSTVKYWPIALFKSKSSFLVAKESERREE